MKQRHPGSLTPLTAIPPASGEPEKGMRPAGQGVRPKLFHEMATEHLDTLRRKARRLTRNSHDAEDLVQETLLRAWRSLHTYRPGTNSRAWLLRILRNVHIDRLRAAYRAAKTTAEAQGDDRVPVAQETPESLFMGRLVDVEVHQALMHIPEVYRVCVILADLEGASYTKIMDALAIPRGTVMSRLFRGRRAMRRLLTAYGREHGYPKAS